MKRTGEWRFVSAPQMFDHVILLSRRQAAWRRQTDAATAFTLKRRASPKAICTKIGIRPAIGGFGRRRGPGASCIERRNCGSGHLSTKQCVSMAQNLAHQASQRFQRKPPVPGLQVRCSARRPARILSPAAVPCFFSISAGRSGRLGNDDLRCAEPAADDPCRRTNADLENPISRDRRSHRAPDSGVPTICPSSFDQPARRGFAREDRQIWDGSRCC